MFVVDDYRPSRGSLRVIYTGDEASMRRLLYLRGGTRLPAIVQFTWNGSLGLASGNPVLL
jgi:hypothetical protein